MATSTISIPPRKSRKPRITDEMLDGIEKALTKLPAGEGVVVGDATTQGKAYSHAGAVRDALKKRDVAVKAHAVPGEDDTYTPAVSPKGS